VERMVASGTSGYFMEHQVVAVQTVVQELAVQDQTAHQELQDRSGSSGTSGSNGTDGSSGTSGSSGWFISGTQVSWRNMISSIWTSSGTGVIHHLVFILR
jgi:hypothetical protein